MQLREPLHRFGSKGVTATLNGPVSVVFAGVVKSTWNFQKWTWVLLPEALAIGVGRARGRQGGAVEVTRQQAAVEGARIDACAVAGWPDQHLGAVVGDHDRAVEAAAGVEDG